MFEKTFYPMIIGQIPFLKLNLSVINLSHDDSKKTASRNLL